MAYSDNVGKTQPLWGTTQARSESKREAPKVRDKKHMYI